MRKVLTFLLNELKSLFRIRPWIFFIILCLINFIALYLYTQFVLTDHVYFQTYGEKVALDNIVRFVQDKERFKWFGYVVVPFVLLVKICFSAFCLNIGTLVADIKLKFLALFRIAIFAEIVFVTANFFRAYWLGFIKDVSTLNEIQFFFPLSLINLFSSESLDSWYIYPITLINIFEIIYIFFLAIGIHTIAQISLRRSLLLVLSCYGLGILIWAVFVVFLSINLS